MSEERYYVGRYGRGTWLIYDRQRPAGDRQLPGGVGSRKEADTRCRSLNLRNASRTEDQMPAPDGLASPQVNSGPLDDSNQKGPQTAGEPPSRVGAAPSLAAEFLRDAIDTAQRNDDYVRLDIETAAMILRELEERGMVTLDVALLRRLHAQWNDTEYGIDPVECDQVMMQIPAVLAELEHLDHLTSKVGQLQRVSAVSHLAIASYLAAVKSEDEDGIWGHGEFVDFTKAMRVLDETLGEEPS